MKRKSPGKAAGEIEPVHQPVEHLPKTPEQKHPEYGQNFHGKIGEMTRRGSGSAKCDGDRCGCGECRRECGVCREAEHDRVPTAARTQVCREHVVCTWIAERAENETTTSRTQYAEDSSQVMHPRACPKEFT
ncbi:unnamed protein product [Heligmosomoides polygyrus]|uniref:Uncharacterized protein n=1 Tax=Heligmosomoides polygyrus TaxID=6339 RepID=A0A183GJQ9_HELPZ|nr:unnamed protein product [Heligmosomoides polygyrus]